MCLKLGIDDPRAWLDTAPKDVIELWEAYWRIEPWGIEWFRYANLMAMLDRIYAGLVNPYLKRGKGHKPQGADDYMPSDWALKKKQNRSKGLLSQLDQFAKAMTGGNNH